MFEDLYYDLSFDLEAFRLRAQGRGALDRLVLYHTDYLHFPGTSRASEGIHLIDLLNQFCPVFSVLPGPDRSPALYTQKVRFRIDYTLASKM